MRGHARNWVMIALFSSVLCVSALISIPAFGIPITLQSFGVAAALFIMGAPRALASVLVYVCIGLVGLPVFSGFNGGVGAILGPSGGFIIGLVLLCLIYYLITAIMPDTRTVRLIAYSVGHIASYIVGTVWFVFVYSDGVGFFAAFAITVLPFVIPDIMKTALAFYISERMRKHIKI